MSTNSLESSPNESIKNRSAPSIRNYFLSSKPLACTENIPKESNDDNVISTIPSKKTPPSSTSTNTTNPISKTNPISTTDSTTTTTTTKPIIKKPNTKPEKSRSFLDLLNAKKPTMPSTLTREFPSLKRSHSAISQLDKASKTWLNEPIKLRKKNHEKETYDRLTPKIIDMPSAQFIMNSSQSYLDPNTDGESYQLQVAKACGLDSTKRILTFTSTVSPSKKVDLRKNPLQPKLLTRKSTCGTRHILSSPDKILDAPYMDDDYYLNLLDWSSLHVVAISLGKSVFLWSSENGSLQSLNYDSDHQVTSLSWSNDGAYLSVGTTSGDTQVWDVESNTKLRSMTGQDTRIGVLSWDKHIVSSGGKDGSIWHHDVRMAKHNVRELYGHVDDVCGLKWRWDGQLLASGGNDDTVNIWDARSATPKFTKTTHSGAIKALAWCPWKHNTLATGGGRDDKNIHFWDTVTGSRRHTIQTGSQVTSLHWSKHYHEIVSTHGNPHNQVTIWEYPSLNKVIDIPAHESRILHSALSPDGQTLATAAADDNLKFWRIFEANGKSPLSTEYSRLTEKKESNLRRSHSIR